MTFFRVFDQEVKSLKHCAMDFILKISYGITLEDGIVIILLDVCSLI